MMHKRFKSRRAKSPLLKAGLFFVAAFSFYVSLWLFWKDSGQSQTAMGIFFGMLGGLIALLSTALIISPLLFPRFARLAKNILRLLLILSSLGILYQVTRLHPQWGELLQRFAPASVPLLMAVALLLWTLSVGALLFFPSVRTVYLVSGCGTAFILASLLILNLHAPYVAQPDAILFWSQLCFLPLSYTLWLGCLGVALILISHFTHRLSFTQSPSWYRTAFPLILVSFAVLSWRINLESTAAEVYSSTQKETAQMSLRLQESILSRLNTLSLFARRWGKSGEPTANNWTNEATLLVSTAQEWKTIFWVDTTYQARWPVSGRFSKTNYLPKIPTAHFNPLELARHFQRPALFPARDSLSGEHEVWVYIPVSRGFQLLGYVTGILPMEELISEGIGAVEQSQYGVSVFDGDEKIYADDRVEGSGAPPVYTFPIKLPNTEWSVRFRNIEVPVGSQRRIHSVFLLELMVILFVGIRLRQGADRKMFADLKALFHSPLTRLHREGWAALFHRDWWQLLSLKFPYSAKSYRRAVWAISSELIELGSAPASELPVACVPFNFKRVLDQQFKMFDSVFRSKGVSIGFKLSDKLPRVLYGDAHRLKQILSLTLIESLKSCNKRDFVMRIFPVHATPHQVDIQFELICMGKKRPADLAVDPDPELWCRLTSIVTPEGIALHGIDLAKALVVRQQGEWSCREEPSHVVVYRFSGIFELRNPANLSDSILRTKIAQKRVKSFLVVESHPSAVQIMSHLLAQCGGKADCLTDLESGSQKVKNLYGRYDAIFVDTHGKNREELKRMSELIFLRLQRKSPVPIIAMLPRPTDRDRNRLMKYRFSDVIAKPTKLLDLKQLLEPNNPASRFSLGDKKRGRWAS